MSDGGGIGGVGSRRAVRLRLTGRVQGVGFRWFARRAARELGVAGRVRNLPDGSVEAVAVGDPAGLAQFHERLREGPPGSRVLAVEEQEIAVVPDWEGFEIDH
ncbi:MAG TPA: acylphosphatase [Thermoanaerobaculia bacterium]|nr:acylphosphatase [Thermoanaerobaculia bacterium]